MGANGNINDLELAKFIELAGEYGIRVHILHGDNWNPAVANMAALPPTGNTIGDIRQALDTGIPYRWNGSAWSVWSTAGASWGGISGTLSAQTDLQAALDAKMGAGAYVLVSRDSLLANQINLGAMTSGILKQTVSAGIATITILTDNSTNWNAAYTHTSNTSNPHSVTKSQVGLGNVDNTSDVNKPVSTAQQTALDLKANIASPTFTGTVTVPTPSNATDAVTKSYADALVAGLLDYRGGYDASINLFPSTGGSGLAGAVVKGDMWIISVAGTLGGTAVQIGDSIIVNVDTPGQTAGNWNILDSNISYVPEDVANKSTSVTTDQASNTKYPSVKSVYDWAIGLFVQKNGAITGATKTKVTYDAKGLVIAGADATTADITDSTNKRYVTDANLTTIANQSGTNSGNETTSTMGTLINGSTDQPTPADTDLFALGISSVLRKVTYANLKASLKTYFDSLATTLTNKTLTAPIITTAINAQTGTTYTFVLTDQSKLVTLTNASAIAVTIPTNASVAFPIGTQIDCSQDGAGKVTFSGAGVTINSLSSLKSIGGQYVGVTLKKMATDTWNLYGNLIA